MRVTVNGEPRDINASHVDALLAELDYEGSHFAIALNYDVVPKSRWAETAAEGRRRDRDHHAAAGRVMCMGADRAPQTPLSSPGEGRAIQYAAASRCEPDGLWNTGSPLTRG